MPNWKEVLDEIASLENQVDVVRRKYLLEMHKITNRNVIAYYSGWLQKPGLLETSITDEDKNAFMVTVHKLDRTKGLDLFLHTPGGCTASTESIVNYLHKMFRSDIRAIIPQLAMSAGTMIACACKEICMGTHSNLGPIDPQFNGFSADGVIEEFNDAVKAIKEDPASIPIWQTIIAKYHPTFLGDCNKAIDMSKSAVENWLKEIMFLDDPNSEPIINNIIQNLASHAATKMHNRHIHSEDCKKMGLKVLEFENELKDIQDIVLTIHHCFMHTFSSTLATKIVENHNGVSFIKIQRQLR